ncbi:MAG: phosphoglucosamine mutase [Gemmatales bacterium]|nr:MAG: phosphoglucosamine mutase [Gemmatales bacterium]
MEKPLIVSVSGIRGIVGSSLTPDSAMAFAQALAATCDGQRLVLSRDSRPSGLMLQHAVLAGLLGSGCEVWNLGIAPTPTCGLAIRRLNAAGGIQITASHNPPEWNGLKLFGADGMVVRPSKGQAIKDAFAARSFRYADWKNQGKCFSCPEALEWHCQRVMSLLDTEAIRRRRFKVVLDANGGAGGPLGKTLLESLGCEVASLGCETNGNFIHPPEPIADNLVDVGPQVSAANADLGFVLDPDADRLAIFDERGRYIGEELTLALAVWRRLQEETGPVVINMSTSRVVEDIAARFGVPCLRTPVGEVHVASKIRDAHACIGGEGNGGVIDPRVGLVRDPFIGMGLILSLLAANGKKLSELVAELPTYHIVKTKIPLSSDLPALYQRVRQRWPEVACNEDDGLRLDWQTHWLHIRPSNTEPIARVIAEAPEHSQAIRLCEEVSSLARSEEN